MGNYYDDNALEYINNTIDSDMSVQYQLFEKHLNKNAKTILDIGFGSGRDMLHFSQKYEVYGIDSTQAFCEHAKELGLNNVYCMNVKEMNFENKFDAKDVDYYINVHKVREPEWLEEPFISDQNSKLMHKLIIPKELKKEILEYLDKEKNINSKSLEL